MRTFVINLEKDKDRYALVANQLERLGIAFERFPAVDGRALSADEMRRSFRPVRSFLAMKKRMSRAEIGVALSHVGCCRAMVETRTPVALILEDDVVLDDRFPSALERTAAFLDPNRPQVITFSGFGIENGANLPAEIRPERALWCTDAYCLTLPAARLMLKANEPVISVSDSFKRWRRWFGLELYRVLPTTVRQDDVTFASGNVVLPKSNWFVRNLMWLADWILLKVFKA